MNENTESQKLQPPAMPVQALMEKYTADSTFRAEFDAASTREDAVRVADQHGIPVSVEDIIALGEASNELSDDILDRVSGGSGPGERYSNVNFTFN
jgi:predicted ribosomally synthesized peptide with nif11-like leader